MKPIEGMTRECQYVDEKWHRCGRLAHYAIIIQVGTSLQYSYRCDDEIHRKSASHAQSQDQIRYVDCVTVDDDEFELGYKP